MKQKNFNGAIKCVTIPLLLAQRVTRPHEEKTPVQRRAPTNTQSNHGDYSPKVVAQKTEATVPHQPVRQLKNINPGSERTKMKNPIDVGALLEQPINEIFSEEGQEIFTRYYLSTSDEVRTAGRQHNAQYPLFTNKSHIRDQAHSRRICIRESDDINLQIAQ